MATNKRKKKCTITKIRLKLDNGTTLVVGPKSGGPMQIFCIPHGSKIFVPGNNYFVINETERFTSLEVINAPDFVILKLYDELNVYSRHPFGDLWNCDAFIEACESMVQPARLLEIEPVYE